MTLPGYAAGKLDSHYSPPACAKQILGNSRADEGPPGPRQMERSGRIRIGASLMWAGWSFR